MVVALAVLLGSACTPGTDDSAAPGGSHTVAGGYAGAFDAVTQQFRVRSEDLQSRAEGVADDADRIVALYSELRDIAADARLDYGDLEAPAEVQSVHQQILQLFDRQVRLLGEVIEAAEASDQDALVVAVQGLVDLTAEFDQARQAMQQAIATCGAPCTT